MEKEEKSQHTYTKPTLFKKEEVETFPTLKEYILNDVIKMEIVYEKLYPISIPTSQRNSLIFTELVNLHFKRPIKYRPTEMDYLLEQEKNIPYYHLKDSNDETLIFESKFECGNLCLVAKVSIK